MEQMINESPTLTLHNRCASIEELLSRAHEIATKITDAPPVAERGVDKEPTSSLASLALRLATIQDQAENNLAFLTIIDDVL